MSGRISVKQPTSPSDILEDELSCKHLSKVSPMARNPRGRGSSDSPYGYLPHPDPSENTYQRPPHPGYTGVPYPQYNPYEDNQPRSTYPAPVPLYPPGTSAYPSYVEPQGGRGTSYNYAQHQVPQQDGYPVDESRYPTASSSTPSYDDDPQAFDESRSRSDEERRLNTVASRRNRARRLQLLEGLQDESSDLRRQVNERGALLNQAYEELAASEYEANMQRGRVAEVERQIGEEEGRTRRVRRQIADAEEERKRQQDENNRLWGSMGR